MGCEGKQEGAGCGWEQGLNLATNSAGKTLTASSRCSQKDTGAANCVFGQGWGAGTCLVFTWVITGPAHCTDLSPPPTKSSDTNAYESSLSSPDAPQL